MKSITESIIGRKGAPGKLHEFDDLRYGDIVIIDLPESRMQFWCLYLPEDIALKIIGYASGPEDKFGRFISRDSDGHITSFRADNFVDNFPVCPEDDEFFYCKIIDRIGHIEEYSSIRNRSDVITKLFNKYDSMPKQY